MKELSLNILDIVQNSIRATADEITIEIRESVRDDLFRITIIDNGTGIPEDILPDVTDPFVTTRTKRKMGLGLPLLKYHAELTGGKLEITSETGVGTEITANFSFRHIDRQPLGDIVGVIMLLIASNEKINFIYVHITEKGRYRFSSLETKKYLEVETLNDRILLGELRSIIVENLKEIKASGIDSKESCSTASSNN
jgi:anti-sigma regulatory factor (Ser/Thr protein kinase)